MFKFLFFFFFLTGNHYGFSQNPAHFVIGEKEFANTDVYSVLYDENTDLIYAGTNNGLYVYKQNKFILLTGPEAQIGSSFFAIKQNIDGDVFCKNLNGQIFKVNENLNSYSIYYQVENEEKEGGLFWFYFTPENECMVATKTELKIIKPHDENEIKLILELEEGFVRNVKQINDVLYVHVVKSNGIEIFNYKQKRLNLIEEDAWGDISNSTDNNHLVYFSKTKKDYFYINIFGGVFSKNNVVIPNFKSFVKERFVFINDSVFIGLNSHKGYRYFNVNNDTIRASKILLPNLFISAFHQSKNKGQFFGTFGDGILVVPQANVIKNYHNYLFLGLATSTNNEVAISARSGEVFYVKPEGIELIDKSKSNVDNVWYISNRQSIRGRNFNDFIYSRSRLESGGGGLKDIIELNKESMLVALSNSLTLIHKGAENEMNFVYVTGNDYIILDGERFTGCEWNRRDSLFYYSTNFGVFSRGWKDSISQQFLHKNKPFQVKDMLVYKNELVCATDQDGILFFKGSSLKKQLNDKDGLESNSVKQIYIQNDILFLLNSRGFQVYDLAQGKFIQLGMTEGIVADGITKFSVSEDKVWFLEKHNYFSIDIKNLLYTKTIYDVSELYLDSILVNGSLCDMNSDTHYKYTQNRFEFYYDYREILTKNETDISYTLVGFYDEWKKISAYENKIEFQSLPPGSYKFKIKAKYRGQETKTTSYEFKINPPFWQAWWFLIGISFLSLSLVTIYFRRRIMKVKKDDLIELEKQKLLTETIDSKLKALRSQMNPHFIFNSLNSIQALILRQDTEKSYDYVVMFANLVRKTLRYSDKDFIDIEEEIEFLETYLKLESLRMKTDFRYDINYNCTNDIQIPSLMIQPFIENAIYHGLLHKEGEKRLSINFEFNEEMTCTIVDNGIGRQRAKEIKERQHKTHKSFSLEATKQRMKIIEQQHDKNFGYEFFDVQPSGTKVVLKVPFKHKY
jgi:hypothetical protein